MKFSKDEFSNPGSSSTSVLSETPQQLSTRIPVCIVGPGWEFTSGISYYTCRLANAMSEDYDISVIQLRKLLPKVLYPGRRRVGRAQISMTYPKQTRVYSGVDWWWGLSLVRALLFIKRNKPKILVLQWWTAVTLHTYLILGISARLLGARVVIEMHELQDPSEARMVVARGYARRGLQLLYGLCQGCIVHSKADWQLLESSYLPGHLRVAMAPHGPYDQYSFDADESHSDELAVAAVRQAPRPSVVNILFFGLIRPYKGLEDLIEVFNSFSEEEVAGFWLTVVGETWDGCTEPAHLIQTSRYRDRITFVNEYVSDEVVGAAFAHADVVVLPYRRSSSSGTLHVAMSWGLPVVVSAVGGLPEAASGYAGAIFIEPEDHSELKTAIKHATRMVGERFADPRDWRQTMDALLAAADLATPLKMIKDTD